jgi:hypothetical protein
MVQAADSSIEAQRSMYWENETYPNRLLEKIL